MKHRLVRNHTNYSEPIKQEILFPVTLNFKTQLSQTDPWRTFKMKHLIHLVLILLLTRTAAPTGTGLDKAKRLFSTLQTQMAECPKERTSYPFYTCPSRFWPEILQTFVPIVNDLEEWIRQRTSVDDAIWLHL